MIKNLLALILIFSVSSIFAQVNKEKARTNSIEAARLISNGQPEQSLTLLEEAIKLDPENIAYVSQLGNAYYSTKNYSKAIDLLTESTALKNADEQLFLSLAASYFESGQKEKGIAALESGLKRFPRSGKIYVALGDLHNRDNNASRAIFYYENAVEVEPELAISYYELSKLFLRSDEEVWGMIYGEIFINLARNGSKVEEISRLLFNTYQSEIKFLSDNSFSLSFSKKTVSDTKKFEQPFGIGIYEPLLMEAVMKETAINLTSLDRIRTTFVRSYFAGKKDKIYPNLLFSFQNKIRLDGHLEAYNHWLLKNGDEAGFDNWRSANREKWSRFSQYFDQNKLKIDEKNKFYRTD